MYSQSSGHHSKFTRHIKTPGQLEFSIKNHHKPYFPFVFESNSNLDQRIKRLLHILSGQNQRQSKGEPGTNFSDGCKFLFLNTKRA